MEQRELIKEIPSGKFHSALFTTFSINLYYWEEQLIRALSAKGINYVSALVDSDALSEQLLKFGYAFPGTRPFDFCLHGVKSQGAFHPKIQFYAGNSTVLVLIGSGNITITGHGKNLEVWTPVMVDSTDTPLFPLIRDVWHYLKQLYLSLGKEAEYIVNSVETNCDLLKNEYKSQGVTEYRIGNDSIKFFSNEHSSLFSQCVDWIGDEKIKTITIMSPFYDSKAELVKALYRQFKPQDIRMIYEEDFGVPPKKEYIPDYVSVYRWNQVKQDSGKLFQRYFHSKCFFFEGEKNNYLITGSANASVAAFGLHDNPAKNQEAVLGMKSSTIDYFRMTGFVLNDKSSVEDKPSIYNTDTLSDATQKPVWIKEVYGYYANYNITLECQAVLDNATVNFYSGRRKLVYSQMVDINAATTCIKTVVSSKDVPLYVEIVNSEGEMVSNRQFVIFAERVETNNPSPESTYFRKRYYEIEAGRFVSGEMMNFIDHIINDTGRKSSAKEESSSDKNTQYTVHHFSSLEEYLMDDGTGITGDKRRNAIEKSKMQSTLLFDSIISYISRSAESKQEEIIENEETENVSTSEGSDTPVVKKECKSPKSAESVKQRVIKMFGRYIERLESVVFAERKSTNTLVLMDALKQFMAAEYFIYRTLSYRFVIDEDGGSEKSLIDIKKSAYIHNTATEFFYRIVALFSLYLMRSDIEQESNIVLKQKIDSYRQYAFELGVAIFSVTDWINEGNPDYLNWSSTYKAGAMLNLQKALDGQIDVRSVESVFRRIDRAIQEMKGFDKSNMEHYIQNNLKIMLGKDVLYPEGAIYFSEQFGYVNLLPYKSTITAIPCTIAAGYNKEKKYNCPNYLFKYEDERMLPIKPSKCNKA